jgi:hypothetical protein
MGAESITRAKSIARGRFTANYYTLKLVFWQNGFEGQCINNIGKKEKFKNFHF